MTTGRSADGTLRHCARRTRTAKAAGLTSSRAGEAHEAARGFEFLIFLTHALELEAKEIARCGGQPSTGVGTRERNESAAQKGKRAARDLPQDLPQRGSGATGAAAAQDTTNQTTEELVEFGFVRYFEQFRGEFEFLGLAKGAALHALEIDALLCLVLHTRSPE